jgi:hypothetical protein
LTALVREPAATPASERTAARSPGVTAATAVLVGVAVAYGAYERWWVAAHPIGALTSDGAVIGLMARHLLHHGELPAYMWGQSYGGSLEVVVTAAIFLVAGTGVAQLLAGTAFTSAFAAFALWRCGRQLVGEPAALLGALALWVWPSLFLWRSLKPGGTYIIALGLALFAVSALARLRRGDARTWVVASAGVWAGLAVWSSPMSLQLLVPAVLWCWRPLVALGRRLWWLAAGAAVGALPAIAFGATHHLRNLSPPTGGSLLTGIPSRLYQFFQLEAPIALAVRVEGSFAWVLGPVGPLLYVAALGGFVAVAIAVRRGRAPRCALPVLTLVCLPVLFALNRLANHPGQGRYVEIGFSMAALLVGVGLENAGRFVARRWQSATHREARTLAVAASGLVLLAVLGAVAVRTEPTWLAELPAGGVAVPPDDVALRALLAAHGVRDAYAPYWLAYRTTFETGEQTTVVPEATDRYPPYDAAVAASAHPAYLFMARARGLAHFERWCTRHGIRYAVWRRGVFAVVQPAARVLEPSLPHSAL